MKYLIEGTVHVVTDTQTFGQKGFRKREVVLIEDNGQYKQHIPIVFVQDACNDVDDVNSGDEVKIEFELGGREWDKGDGSDVRYFLEAKAIQFKVTKKNPFDVEDTVTEAENVPF